MSDNILQTLQQLVQDVIAPDVRELKVRLSGFEKLVDERFASLSKEMSARFSANDARSNAIDSRFDAIDARFDALEERFESQAKQMDAQFKAVLSAISELRAQSDLAGLREIGQLRERIAVLEAKTPAKAS